MEPPAANPDADALPVRRVMLLACGIAAILALAVSAQVYLSMLDHGHSFARIFAWQMGSWGFWGLVSPLALRRGRSLARSRPMRRALPGALVLGAALTATHMTVTALFTIGFRPFYPLPSGTFRGVLLGQLPSLVTIDTLVYGLLLVGGSAYCAHRGAQRLELRESRLEAELARAQLEALRLEIQPHFLFNTLNSIAALIRLSDNRGALKMLLGLSEMMRAAVERPKDHLVPLSEEIELVSRYVDLQRVRFADRLAVEYRIGEDCRGAVVPTFLLQPLVENALQHGAAPQARTCHVQIGASVEAGRLRLWVSDDGAGLPNGFDMRRDAGTGLRNTSSRLTQLYGAAASFDVRTGDVAGTTVEIGFPSASSFQPADASI